MTMQVVDTHTHLFTEEFDDDREEVIARALESGVNQLFMPNIDEQTIDRLLDTCRRHPLVCYPMMGLHPTSVTNQFEEQLAVVYNSLMQHRNEVVAIGEVGVDLYWDDSLKAEQVQVFARQAEWALQFGLPLVIHCRNAFQQVREVLEPYRGTALRGVFHSFTGDRAEAEQMLAFKNFFIGINGIVTFKKSELAQMLPDIPLERVVLETDSPYLSPVPMRGKRNESAHILHVLNKVAELYQLSATEVAQRTTANAHRLFSV